MPTFYEIPTRPMPQRFAITLGGITYYMTLLYQKTDINISGWTLDIADASGVPMISGIPLVTGCDLLAQHKHTSIGAAGAIICATDGATLTVPTFENLGSAGHLYFATFP